jgi:hypothetical protein
VYSTKSVKWEVEKAIKEHLKEANKDKPGRISSTPQYKFTEFSYVSYVVVDAKDGEVVIESKEKFLLPEMAVAAAST